MSWINFTHSSIHVQKALTMSCFFYFSFTNSPNDFKKNHYHLSIKACYEKCHLDESLWYQEWFNKSLSNFQSVKKWEKRPFCSLVFESLCSSSASTTIIPVLLLEMYHILPSIEFLTFSATGKCISHRFRKKKEKDRDLKSIVLTFVFIFAIMAQISLIYNHATFE